MTDILNRLLGHNAWTTQQLLDRARELPPGQYVQRFDIGPGSVHDTLLHIIDVMFGCGNGGGEVVVSWASSARRRSDSYVEHDGGADGGKFAAPIAESAGFEPAVPLRAHLISNQAPSTTRPALRGGT